VALTTGYGYKRSLNQEGTNKRTVMPSETAKISCRLLYLIGQLGPGGSERQLYYLLRTMDRKRYQPAVAVWNFSEDDVYVAQVRGLGVPLYCFPTALSELAKLRALRRLVRQLEPEVIHSYSFYLNVVAHWGVQRTRAVACGSIRSDFLLDKKSIGWWRGRLNARWPRDQICNSFVAAEGVRHSRSLFVPERLSVVCNGVDVERFRSVPLTTEGRVSILGVGSLLPVKRWDRLLGAALELKRRGADYCMRIAGDGFLRRSLEQQAQDLGITDRVEFLGYTDDIPGLLSEATFLVHTSDNEGCPNIVMEAMACGRAVVATDAGDVTHLVEDGKTGFVVRRGDDTTLVTRMATLIVDRGLCRHMGDAGRAKAEREFSLNRLVEVTLAAYQAAGWKDS
jgi:glycosyltransferase involved in cell wall biosynthesis